MVLKVLTVDDSTTITTHLEYILSTMPEMQWVGHAYTLKNAQSLIFSHAPDVVLLDIMVNQENGFDLLEYIRQEHPTITVCMLSNLNDAIYIKKSKALGATHFIDKSFDFDSIPFFLKEIYQQKYLAE